MRDSALSGLLRWAVWCCLALFALTSAVHADPKVMLLEDTPGEKYRFTVAPDGSRIIIAASRYFVYDAGGRLVDRIGVPQGCSTRDLLPLPADYDPLIKYISCTSYAGGHLATVRADGSEIATIVGRGAEEKLFHPDSTGWTNPLGAVLDFNNKLIFAIESSQPAQGQPNPAWSRIAEFDLRGNFIRSINFFNCEAKAGSPERDDARRMWYQDVKVDAHRRQVYVLSSTTRELLAFDYDGKLLGRTSVPIGDSTGLAVLADGRIAVGSGLTIKLFTPDTLTANGSVALPAEIGNDYAGIRGLQTDAAGRLYALLGDARVNFIRWTPDLQRAEVFGPRYIGLNVDFPDNALASGAPFTIKVAVTGRPAPTQIDRWQVLVRPSDGSDLRWQPLPAACAAGTLTVRPPATLRGVYELAVRYGDGPISYAGRANDPSLQRSVTFVPAGDRGSLAFFPSSGRTAFRQGEEIAVELVRRPPEKTTTPEIDVSCVLEQEGAVLQTTRITLSRNAALCLPAALTARLLPGHYLLRPREAGTLMDGDECYPFPFDIASTQPDSPMQRVLYHEFGNAAVNGDAGGADIPERLYYVRDTLSAVHRLGFTRETDRSWPGRDGNGWRRENAPADLGKHPGYAPAEYYALSTWGSLQDFYFDQAVRDGVVYDAQILPHCASVRVRDERIAELLPGLSASAQWAGRYPSFYGFNYNDEMFFWSNYDDRWHKEDSDWFNVKIKEQFKDDKPAAYQWALGRMYDGFNAVVQRVNPALRRTTTPMWQFPAVEGSYAPTIYRDMTESYSHFLSEGYALPFVPAHSADMLHRPGLPHIGIADNGYGVTGGDLYQKTTMQLFLRGTQGVGVSHTTAFQDPHGAQAYRTTNELAKMYGPIFAQATRADEAAVLYSYTQDIKEGRAGMGTPHWERVYGLYGAGLMAGVPMTILYEEDVNAGWLLDAGKPRVPMLFLVGQKTPLPPPVQAAIERYRAAGGKIFADAACADVPGATKLPFDTRVDSNLGYASDTAWPLQQPIFATIAEKLRPALTANITYPMSTDDPWVLKSSYRAGAARYLLLATETSPFPWEAGAVWGMGAFYCKNAFTWLPKTVTLTIPATRGVVYDVFEHTLVTPARAGAGATLHADLTTFPGRLYAVLPAPLGAPRLATARAGATLAYKVAMVDSAGKRLAAQIPLRIRLLAGQPADARRVGLEIYRATDTAGVFTGSLAIPLAGSWTLEVSELLGGNSSAAPLPAVPAPDHFLSERPAVEIQRPLQLGTLLADARKAGKLVLVQDNYTQLSAAQCRQLQTALAAQGITLSVAEMPKNAAPAIYLSVGIAGSDRFLGEFITDAWNKNLFDYPRSASVPGVGRGFVTTAFAARNFGEDCLVLLGGDKTGLDKTVDAFLHWLATPMTASMEPPHYVLSGKPVRSRLPALHDAVGVRLAGVRVAGDGTHLAVSANGYMQNLALLDDEGDQGRLLRTARVGQAPTTDSLFVSDDGSSFGASGRTTERFAQGFYLTESATGAQQVFAGFGDIGRNVNRFAASADGRTVVTTGTYGALCWARDGDAWRVRWSYDYWKSFNALEWPISDLKERIPQFHAVLPRGADYVLLVFGEFSNNGWVTPENVCTAQILALNLRDGSTRWTYNVPIPRTQLFPTIFASPDGSQLLLQVQLGSWGKETYRFFTVDVRRGTQRAQWDAPVAPTGIAVADGSGRIAEAFANRLLEVREQDGTLCYNLLWPENMPVSVAFAPDGQGLYVADDAGMLTALDSAGALRWKVDMGCLSYLGAGPKGLYAAGWDGRLRAFSPDGTLRWTTDCTPALKVAHPMTTLAATTVPANALHLAANPSNTSPLTPAGDNLLCTGKATLTVGGTSGWMSGGQLQIKAEDLVSGKTDAAALPWLSQSELFWDGTAGRQVWAQITFTTPTDVSALTVYENPNHPESWPTDAVVQVWDDAQQTWKTAVYGVFLNGAINTYTLNLKAVTKLRYAPWGSYYRNFYTTKIEVRGMTP